MLINLIIYFYRFISVIFVLVPITLNVLFPSGIIESILYIPLISLSLSIFFIYFDKQLLNFLKITNKRLLIYKDMKFSEKNIKRHVNLKLFIPR